MNLMIILIIVAVIAAWLWATYNSLVTTNVRADEAWSDIEVQLKRRADLIPNLVDTVKGFASQEKEVFENVTKARSQVVNATGVKETAEAENMFTGALKSLFAVAEDYPDLKSDKNFLALQDELVDTENKVQAARRFYNSAVRDLNTKIKIFPNNLFANQLGFDEREFFETEDRSVVEQPAKVEF